MGLFNRLQKRLRGKTRHAIVKADGLSLVVARPASPEKALKRIDEIHALPKEEQNAAFEAMLDEQPYTFVGYYTGTEHVVDKDGFRIGSIRPGDSFISLGENYGK